MRVENIYEIYDFLYFEPQHIGKIKNPKTTYNSSKKMIEHIKNLEVSLNHILNLFFEFRGILIRPV